MEWVNETAAAVDEKLGLIAVQVPYHVAPITGESKLETLQRALTFLPTELDSFFLPRVKRDVREQGDGSYKVVFSFDGKADPENETGEEFSLDATTSEDPIESHEDIKELIETYAGERTDEGKVIFDLNLDLDGEEVKNPMHGVSAYLVPGMVWTHTFVRRRFDRTMVQGLGCIDHPPTGSNGQAPPALEGKRNWLLIRVRAEWRGNVWKISRSWMMSGPGGWNELVYRWK